MTPQQNPLAVPIAIVIAGGLVALAVFFGGSGGNTVFQPTTGATTDKENVPAVTASDHIIGNQNAKIKIVEYTDLECPFCKQFHTTMKQIMDEYGPSGNVAWVLRNFPLAQLHPNAPALALAAECVAELEGNASYWAFIDAIFEKAPINSFFDLTELDSTAASVGVDTAAFRTCYDSERHREKVEKDFAGAVAAGGQGTPFNTMLLSNKLSSSQVQAINALNERFRAGTLTVSADGKSIEIAGAQPYEVVKAVIDAVL